MAEDHAHAHVSPTPEEERKYRSIYLSAWLLTFVIVALELVGSLVSGSIALLADIGHVLTDSFIALVPLSVAVAKSKKIASPRSIERVGGIVAALVLLGIGGNVLWESLEMLGGEHAHHHVEGAYLFIFALGALVVNILQHRLLRQVSPMHRHAAHSGYHFHVLTDLLKNALLPALGILIFFGVPETADIYAAVAIGILVILRAAILLCESFLGEQVVQRHLHALMHALFR